MLSDHTTYSALDPRTGEVVVVADVRPGRSHWAAWHAALDIAASDPEERRAIVPGTPPEQVAPYLPGNYRAEHRARGGTVIIGRDRNGWTLEDYVIPRLASGLIFARIPSTNDRDA